MCSSDLTEHVLNELIEIAEKWNAKDAAMAAVLRTKAVRWTYRITDKDYKEAVRQTLERWADRDEKKQYGGRLSDKTV